MLDVGNGGTKWSSGGTALPEGCNLHVAFWHELCTESGWKVNRDRGNGAGVLCSALLVL